MVKRMRHMPTGEIRLVGPRHEICEDCPEGLLGQQVIACPESDLAWEATPDRMAQMSAVGSAICRDCGLEHGEPSDRVSSVWIGVCDYCQKEAPVSSPRDWGYPILGFHPDS